MPRPRIRARPLLSALCAQALCAASAAAVPPQPEVALLVSGPPPAASALARALTHDPQLPVTLREVALPNSPLPPATAGAEAALLEAVAHAESAYVAADFDACLAALGERARALAVLADGARHGAARLLLWRIACDVGRGAEAEARRSADAFAVLELDVPADVSRVAPDAEAVLSEALRSRANRQRAPWRLSSQPAGVAIDVDGRPAGCETPCTLAVHAGQHVLALHGDGITPIDDTAEVPEGGAAYTRALEEAPPALAAQQWSARYRDGRDLESPSSLRLLARALPAQRLLVLTLEPGRNDDYALRGSYVVNGAVLAREGAAADGRGQGAERARRLMSTLLVRGNTLALPRPLWKSGWFWTAVGAAAVGAALGTGLALRPARERTEVRFQ